MLCSVGFILFGVVYLTRNDKIKSHKPIIPELQITGNSTKMDTVYIYKLEE